MNSNRDYALRFIKHKEDVGRVFICDICGKKDMAFYGYLSHMRTHGLDKKGVYDRFHKLNGDGLCKVCGKETKFAPPSNKWGYHDLCNEHDKERRNERRKKTNLAKYGVENVGQLEQVQCSRRKTYKERTGYDAPLQNPSVIDKIKKTNKDRYNVEWSTQSDIVKDKIKKTFESKYINGHPWKDPNIIDKRTQTLIDRYGVPNPMQSSSIRDRAFTRAQEFFHQQINTRLEDLTLLDLSGNKKGHRVRLQCNSCQHIFEHYVHNGMKPLCPRCYKAGRSKEEQELYKVLISMGHEVILGDRKHLGNGQELDLFIPKSNIAIEYNSLYWHSDLWNIDKQYHLRKTELANSNGIDLLHIFEDEWYNKRDIWISIIRNRLGHCDNKIFARKCSLINDINLRLFYENYHLQGNPSGKLYNYALIYEGDIVCGMTVSPSYVSRGTTLELARYACKSHTIVVGGFSRLLKAISRDFNKESLTTFADRRYSKGSIYRSQGFTLVDSLRSGFYYTKNGKRYNRMQFQKHKLAAKLEKFDPLLSEVENMKLNGYHKIYDCGQLKFVLT